VGICDKKYENTFNYFKNKPFYYYINKLSYGETINLLSNMNLVVGTEGSLTQVSTTLHIPTIIIETGKSFWRYSNLGKTHNIKLFSKRITADHIFQEIVAFQINLHQ
jgi:ADP-heptose:LPS heptosyltransferase